MTDKREKIFQECLLNKLILGNLTAKVTSNFCSLFAQCGAGSGLQAGRVPWMRKVAGPQLRIIVGWGSKSSNS